MSIILFKELTTDDYLTGLQSEADKYDGLYVDMADKEQRAYVKDKAVLITGLLKKLDRTRIDLSRDFKQSVEKEALDIKERLESANKPFTLLIDDWTNERKKVLAEKKAKEDAVALIVQIEVDHASAIDMDKLMMFEQKEAKEAQEKRDAEIADSAAREATEKAEYDAAVEADRIERRRAAIETDKINAQKAREADVEHKRTINREALDSLRFQGFVDAEDIIRMIAQGKIANVTINY